MECTLNTNKCDKLSKLRGLDLKELLLQVRNNYIEYRDNLGLDSDITFGTEIEFSKTRMAIVIERMLLISNEGWIVKKDNSVTVGNEDYCNGRFYDKNGIEINSDYSISRGGEVISPILNDNIKTWTELKSICEMLKSCDAVADNSTSAHIHFGTQILGDDDNAWIDFIYLWIIYEKIIYRFAYGETLSFRSEIEKYARPMSRSLFSNIKYITNKDSTSVRGTLRKIYPDRNWAINFCNTKMFSYNKDNTLEIRCPNGTIEQVIWQNNINFFSKLFIAAKNNKIDRDIIEKELYKYNSMDNILSLYNNIYFEEALELSDMIFDNNLDKINFLTQYFKSFEVNNSHQNILAKPFIKK